MMVVLSPVTATITRCWGGKYSLIIGAVVLGLSYVLRVGDIELPTREAFHDIYWIAAAAGLFSAFAAVFIPSSRRQEANRTHTGNDVIIHGHVRDAPGRPARSAVTTLLTDIGEEVDWSRVEPDGSYSLVLPGPVVYQRITNADGYQPRAEPVRIDKPGAYDVELGPRLELTGLVRLEGRPVSDASITVTTASGEVELTTTAGPDGRFAVRLGVTERHVVSVIDPSTGASRSCHVVVLGSVAPLVVDLEPVSAFTVDA